MFTQQQRSKHQHPQNIVNTNRYVHMVFPTLPLATSVTPHARTLLLHHRGMIDAGLYGAPLLTDFKYIAAAIALQVRADCTIPPCLAQASLLSRGPYPKEVDRPLISQAVSSNPPRSQLAHGMYGECNTLSTRGTRHILFTSLARIFP